MMHVVRHGIGEEKYIYAISKYRSVVAIKHALKKRLGC